MSSNQLASESSTNLPVAKHLPAIEALAEIIIKLLGLFAVYWVFDLAGEKLIGGEFNPDTLLSLVILPAIYILKDTYVVFDPYFIRVSLSSMDVTVESGILTKRQDCLKLKNVENVELITTIMGRCLDYGSLNLYAYGSWVEIPHIQNISKVQAKVESSINK